MKTQNYIDTKDFAAILISDGARKAKSEELFPYGSLSSEGASLAIAKAIVVSLKFRERYNVGSDKIYDEYKNIYSKEVEAVVSVLCQHTSVRGPDVRAAAEMYFLSTFGNGSANEIFSDDPVRSVLDYFGFGFEMTRKTMTVVHKERTTINSVLKKSLPIVRGIVEAMQR